VGILAAHRERTASETGERLYCVSSVFAPSGLDTRLYHHWQHYERHRLGTAPAHRLRAGRAVARAANRGYTWKQNLAPGNGRSR